MEQQILFWVNLQWTNPAMDRIMAAFSSFDLWFMPLCLLGAGLLIFGGFKARATLVIALGVVAISDGLVGNFLKKTTNRPRPNEVLAGVRCVGLQKTKPRVFALFRPPLIKFSYPEAGKKINGRSFPSNHTMDNFAVATVVAVFYRRWGKLCYIPAGLVGYSRIYTGSHWPTDVAISIFLGIGIALLALAGIEALWRQYGSRIAPILSLQHPHLFGEKRA